MTEKKIYLGQQLLNTKKQSVGGSYVELGGETYYKISDYNQMDDFSLA